METALQQAKSADDAMRATAQEVQDALFCEKDMFDDFMTEFATIPEVQARTFSLNRNYQDMLDEYMSRFGAHVESVKETLDNQCEFHEGHPKTCERLKHTCAAVADAAYAIRDERPDLAAAASDYANQCVATMKLQFE